MRPLCATSKTSLAVELMENLGDSLLAAVELNEGEVIVIVGADRTLFHVDSNRSGCWRDGMEVAVRLDVKCVACVPTPLRPYLESIKAS